ncbi:hypothetical protein Taro_026913 [Colocasia esculenta]|uniref:Uncharacterized protein n=1 Tax=Colocasia esculenta TaxID=4460 RepID=A0A843VCM6_COLES|nr:hypothetical protein [Colocasia esculenta]
MTSKFSPGPSNCRLVVAADADCADAGGCVVLSSLNNRLTAATRSSRSCSSASVVGGCTTLSSLNKELTADTKSSRLRPVRGRQTRIKYVTSLTDLDEAFYHSWYQSKKFVMADRRDWGGGGDDLEESTQRMIERIWESLTDIWRRMDQQAPVPLVAVPPGDGETVPIVPVLPPPRAEVWSLTGLASIEGDANLMNLTAGFLDLYYDGSLNDIRVDANLCDLQNIGLPEDSFLTPFFLSLALFSCPLLPHCFQ